MTTQQQILDFYTQPVAMTSARGYDPLFEELPDDISALVRVVQGLLLHEHWAPAYDMTLSDERRSESHLRPVAQMLDRILAHDDRPLSAARPLDKRLIGVCRHFTVLLAAILRAKGIPARARCGFGAYFIPGYFEDHWVCEYWHDAQARWVRVDAQIDELQQEKLKPDFDLLDVPHDRFVIAGDAWARCRAGEMDPDKFGISFINEGGLWFIAGNVVRDAAALNNMEMLPWDDWDAMVGPDEPLQEDQLAFFDRLAALTRAPDASFAELRALYQDDDRLRVPATVFNAVLQRPETI
jgi:hypothetical protein